MSDFVNPEREVFKAFA